MSHAMAVTVTVTVQMSCACLTGSMNECTFLTTAKSYSSQPMFECVTCAMAPPDKCLCLACTRKCHSGHAIVGWGTAKFFCDCKDFSPCKAAATATTSASATGSGSSAGAPPLSPASGKSVGGAGAGANGVGAGAADSKANGELYLSAMSAEDLCSALSTFQPFTLSSIRSQSLSGSHLIGLTGGELELRLSSVCASGLERKKLKIRLQELQTRERDARKRMAVTDRTGKAVRKELPQSIRRIPPADITIFSKIGGGAFGEAFRASWKGMHSLRAGSVQRAVQ
jgi:hypothetical protein